jgi:hypothetical protein
MGMLSTMVGVITFFHFILPLSFITYTVVSPRVFSSWGFREFLPFWLFLDVGLLGFSLSLIWTFERMYKSGEIFLSEISDELQWYKSSSDNEISQGVKPQFELRINLRKFSSGSSLPFMRGAGGAITYVALNIMLSLTLWIYIGVMHQVRLSTLG